MSHSEEFKISHPPTDGITKVQFFPTNPSLLGISSWDKSVSIHKIGTNDSTKEASYIHESAVLDFCIAKNNNIFSGGLDLSLSKIDVVKGVKTIVAEKCHKSSIKCVKYASLGEGDLVVTGSWDKTIKFWDVRMNNTQERNKVKEISTIQSLGKVFSMDISRDGKKMIVGTHNRRIEIYDLGYNSNKIDNPYQLKLSQTRKSPLLYQSRCIKTFPNGVGYAVSSVEARVGIEYFDNSVEVQKKRFAFKCHRSTQNGITTLFPINVIEFHNNGTFLTGGCDGKIISWDPIKKKKIMNFERIYPTSISSLSYNSNCSFLAIASSYTFEMGEKEHPKDEIFIKKITKKHVEYVPRKRK